MKKFIPAAMAAMIIVLLAACSGSSGIEGREDILDKKVAVLSGSVSAGIVERTDPDLELVYCDTAGSLKDALKKGRADCAIVDGSAAGGLTGLLSGFRTVSKPYAELRYAIAVSADNQVMLEKLNAAIAEMKSSGALASIVERPNTAGADGAVSAGAATVTVAVEPDFFPFAYYDETGALAGVEINLVREICRKLDLTADFLPVEADMLLYMAQSGKCSFAIGRLTPADGEGLLYTDSYMDATQYIIVKK